MRIYSSQHTFILEARVPEFCKINGIYYFTIFGRIKSTYIGKENVINKKDNISLYFRFFLYHELIYIYVNIKWV